MRNLIILLFAVIIFLVSTSNALAIVFLPALILIPIAKIVAVVIGGLSIPALGLGAVFHRLFGKSLKKIIINILLVLFVFAVVIFLILKVQNPQRPIF